MFTMPSILSRPEFLAALGLPPLHTVAPPELLAAKAAYRAGLSTTPPTPQPWTGMPVYTGFSGGPDVFGGGDRGDGGGVRYPQAIPPVYTGFGGGTQITGDAGGRGGVGGTQAPHTYTGFGGGTLSGGLRGAASANPYPNFGERRRNPFRG